MNRFLKAIPLWLLFMAGMPGLLSVAVLADENEGQKRVAYFELLRLRTMSAPGISYPEYRGAVVRAREQVGLLRDDSSKVIMKMRTALAYYDKALAVWRLQAEADQPVDSLRTDEALGASLIADCPGIPTFHRKSRDHVRVQDGVACLWRKGAAILDGLPPEQQ